MFVEYTKDQVNDFLIERMNEYTYCAPFSPRHGHTFHYVKFDGVNVEYLYWDGVDYIEQTTSLDKFLDEQVYYKPKNKWDFSS